MENNIYLIGEKKDIEKLSFCFTEWGKEGKKVIIITLKELVEDWTNLIDIENAVFCLSSSTPNMVYDFALERFEKKNKSINIFIEPFKLSEHQKECIGRNKSLFLYLDDNKASDILKVIFSKVEWKLFFPDYQEEITLQPQNLHPQNQYDEDGNLILPVYDEPKKGKLGIILGIISAIIITAGGIVSYHYYIESVSFLSPYMKSKKENNLAKLVTKSDVVSLNDISYVTYSIETILPTPGESLIAEVPVNYSVDWPVSGPDHLVEKIKAWITEQVTTLEGEEIIPFDTSIEKMLIDRFNNLNEQMVLEEGYYEGPAKDEKLVSIAQNGKVINLSGYEDRPNVRQNSWSGISVSEILTVSGKTFSYEFLPDFETIKPLLVKFLLANDEPIGYEYGDVVEALHYPKEDPKFTENGVRFDWGVYETVRPYTIFSSEIPYYDIIPFLNADALEFVPESEIQKFKNAKSNLTENLILELAERGITYPNNPNLSKEFQAIVTLGCLLPNDYPGGIGDNEILMSYWYSGQDGGEDDGFVKAEIISQNEDKAKTKIYYREWGTLHPHSMDLIKEKQILPSGLEIHHWVIDDFDGKKSIVLERLNDQAIEFKNGYGQRLMEDPDESGFMSQSEKEEYIEKVNIFLQEYSNFQSN